MMKFREIEISKLYPHNWWLDKTKVEYNSIHLKGELWVPVDFYDEERPITCDKDHRLLAYSKIHDKVVIYPTNREYDSYSQKIRSLKRFGISCIKDLECHLINHEDGEVAHNMAFALESDNIEEVITPPYLEWIKANQHRREFEELFSELFKCPQFIYSVGVQRTGYANVQD